MKIVFYDHDPYLGGKEMATYRLLRYLNDREHIYYAFTGDFSDVMREKISKYAQIIDMNQNGDAIECDFVVFCTIWHYTTRIIAKKGGRILWAHGMNNDHTSAIYKQKFDYIIYVSETTRNFYNHKVDSTAKTEVIYNIVDTEEISELSKPTFPIKLGRDLTLCTVSRLSPEKGIKKLQFIASMLNRANLNYQWYVIGDGKDKKHVAEIKDIYKHYPNIHFLGEMSNPLQIVKQCNFIVQLSSLDTQNLAILEGKLLGLHAILSDIPAFREFYKDDIIVNMGYGFTLMNQIKDRMKKPAEKYEYKSNEYRWKEIFYGNTKEVKETKVRTNSKGHTTKVSRSKK